MSRLVITKQERVGKPPIPKSTQDQVKELKSSGLSVRAIANKAKISVGSVSKIINQAKF